MKSNNHLLLYGIISFLIVIAGCASPEPIDPCLNPNDEQGFLFGLIHGFLAPLTFIISLFSDDVTMYAVNNNETWYNLGFLLGIGGFSGGIFKGSRRKR
ncbi:MAG: hypothetical protein HKN76_10075 [Saprospiraceae bacterium]|nr:hypothetical protein [Saprospiraceae bacterium]